MANLNSQLAKQELWRRGNLSFKLDPAQKDIVKKLNDNNQKINVVLSSRRLGKSYMACILAVETCLRKPNSSVKFLAPTKLMIESIITPLLNQIFEDCPEKLKPGNNKSKYTYHFHNGSQIQLAGSDGGHAEKLRGSFADLCIVDEAGFCKDLTNTVRSILIPTTLNTKGKIILISTPPKEVDHDFVTTFLEEAELNGSLIKKTIFDNPRITKEEIDQILVAYPGVIKSVEDSVLPEFDDVLIEKIVKEWKKPPFYDAYVAMDIGGRDLTAVVFGYYDFIKSKIIIEDELIMDFQEQSNTIKKLCDDIYNKEKTLWVDPLTNEFIKPYLRVSDINYIVTEEIYKTSAGRVNFVTTKKDDKEAAINNLRVMLGSEKIIINPKCKNLIRHLKNVKWSKNKSTFKRSPDNGHYDLVDALVYFTRSVIYNKNPYPSYYNMNTKDLMVLKEPRKNNENTVNAFKKAFRIKGK